MVRDLHLMMPFLLQLQNPKIERDVDESDDDDYDGDDGFVPRECSCSTWTT